MTTKPLTVEQFQSGISKHKMAVLLDNGLYRHLKFNGPLPNSWNMWFEVITWPGCLTIHGDMGSWCFSRLEDMFQFFRSDDLRINSSYWREKVVSESRFGGPSKIFDPDAYREAVLSRLDGCGFEDTVKADIIEALEEEVFAEGDQASMRSALDNFTCRGFSFSDSWGIEGLVYSYHFLWCLYAIVWAIQQYDAIKKGES